MKTRNIPAGALYNVQQRTDGWYYRPIQTDEEWNGPHLNLGAVAEAMADELEEEMRLFYQFRYKEAPR